MKKRIVSIIMFITLLLTVHVYSTGNILDMGDIGSVYRDAVEMMNKKDVIVGFEDRRFHPKEYLTRSQAAKIVAYIVLGHEKAEKLETTDRKYIDVDTNFWAAPCIEWCTDNGIITGYGDGYFGPGNDLTGYQFAKMLLCALELGKQEDYIGDQWWRQVLIDGAKYKIFEGDSESATNGPITREQAALLAYNAIINSKYYFLFNDESDGIGKKDATATEKEDEKGHYPIVITPRDTEKGEVADTDASDTELSGISDESEDDKKDDPITEFPDDEF